MSRRIILVDIYWTRDKDPRIPLGHASLLAALHGAGHTDLCSVVVAQNGPEGEIDPLCDRILGHAEGLASEDVDVAIGVYVWAEDRVRRLLAELRRRGYGGRIILGGPQISYAEPGVGRLYPEADCFVRGYAEQVLCELVRRPGRPRLPGVAYQGGFDTGSVAAVDLDELASPWLDGVLEPAGLDFVRWETQRGCPYRCSFCQHRESGKRLNKTCFDERRVFAEIDLFCRSGIEDIAVLDPVFNSRDAGSCERACRILEAFAERDYAGRLSLQCRPELIDERFLEACAVLDTRLEFGLQTIVDKEWGPIRRGNKLELVEWALRECHARGIDHEVSLIFGLPEQTLASFERSLQWCLERQVQVIKAFPLMLLRGTALERERHRWQLEEGAAPMPVVVASSSFDRAEWLEMARLSDALRRSEGAHPRTVAELHRGRARAVDFERWSPLF